MKKIKWLHLSIHSTQESWRELCEETHFWLEQMERISLIENHFHIKFQLPEQASETDYLTIDILSDALNRKSVRRLPSKCRIPVCAKNLRRRPTSGTTTAQICRISSFSDTIFTPRRNISPPENLAKKRITYN